MNFIVYHNGAKLGEVKNISMERVGEDRMKICGTWEGFFLWTSGEEMPHPLKLETETLTIKAATATVLEKKSIDPVLEFEGSLL